MGRKNGCFGNWNWNEDQVSVFVCLEFDAWRTERERTTMDKGEKERGRMGTKGKRNKEELVK